LPTLPGWEFYDLANDPHEMINEYKNPKYAEVISTLKQELKNSGKKSTRPMKNIHFRKRLLMNIGTIKFGFGNHVVTYS